MAAELDKYRNSILADTYGHSAKDTFQDLLGHGPS